MLATDLALTVTQRLRALGVAGEFVEFFGPGVATLTAGDRAVVANMAPEYGATTGFFPVDEHTLDYLRATGRAASRSRLVEAYARRSRPLVRSRRDRRATRARSTIDLAKIGMHVAGPRRPQDLLPLSGTAGALARLAFASIAPDAAMPRHPVAIAAITSCTNTSDPRLLIAAGLVARQRARARACVCPPG